MGANKWAYVPGLCDGVYCKGDCDKGCDIAEKLIKGREFIHVKNDLLVRLNLCYTDKDGTIHLYEKTTGALINLLQFLIELIEDIEK